MIGLGSNRLTCCRRGGMSVTQAGRGGMEWLAGGRVPSWTSPYSAQATAALKAAFSAAQWATIRDYGWEHPEIVGYMNAYAPEDAKIAYSLVPTIGYRKITTDGNGYIKTGEYVSMDDTIEVQYEYGSLTAMPWGARGESWGSEALCCASYVNNNITIGFYGAGGSTVAAQPIVVNSPVVIKAKGTDGNWLCDGVSRDKTQGVSGVILTREMYLLAVNRGGNKYDNNPNSIGYYRNYGKSWWVPFIRNNVKGMLEMVSNTFKANAGSGTLTISESPS